MGELEKAVAAAEADEDKIVAFFELFLDSDLYIPVRSAGDGDGPPAAEDHTGATGTGATGTGATGTGDEEDDGDVEMLVFENEGDLILPVFENAERLAGWLQQETAHVVAPGRVLLTVIDDDIQIVLNPDGDHAKLLDKEDLDFLRDWIGREDGGDETAEAGRVVAARPITGLDAGARATLEGVCGDFPGLRAVYALELDHERPIEHPHFILLFDLDDRAGQRFAAVAAAVGEAMVEHFPKDSAIDLASLGDEPDFAEAIDANGVRPLYAAPDG